MSQPAKLWRVFSLCAVMVLSALLTHFMFAGRFWAPTETPDLEEIIPSNFGAWQAQGAGAIILPAELPEEEGVATLYRAYSNQNGEQVMLVIVYGAARGDTMRLHLPEVCYVAQGFDISRRRVMTMSDGASSISAVTMTAADSLRQETVTYWMRVSNHYVRSQIGQQLFFLQTGNDQRRDSALVRISVASRDEAYATRLSAEFMRSFIDEMPAKTRRYLLIDPKIDQGEEA